jgi:aspartyl-tRNA(Asn)/glutamyl-tRNA(Gln) amidotransferase subunit B
VRQYGDGNRKVVGYLVGQGMKASGGSDNPMLFNRLLVERQEARS